MNERIRQLAEQCRMMHKEGTQYIEEFDKEKFAELIIRECAEVCKGRVGNSDYNTGRMHCASDIKEHFGIKE